MRVEWVMRVDDSRRSSWNIINQVCKEVISVRIDIILSNEDGIAMRAYILIYFLLGVGTYTLNFRAMHKRLCVAASPLLPIPDLTASRILSPEHGYLFRIIDVLLLFSPCCSNTILYKDTPPSTKHKKKYYFIFYTYPYTK